MLVAVRDYGNLNRTHIFCDDDFKPLKYKRLEIRQLKQDDKKIKWQEGWERDF